MMDGYGVFRECCQINATTTVVMSVLYILVPGGSPNQVLSVCLSRR